MTLTDISRLVGLILQDIDAQMVATIVEDELLYGLENFGVPHECIMDRLDFAIEAVGIESLRYSSTFHKENILSKGQLYTNHRL